MSQNSPVGGFDEASNENKEQAERSYASRGLATIFSEGQQIPSPQLKNPECVSVQDFLLITSSIAADQFAVLGVHGAIAKGIRSMPLTFAAT